LNASVIRSLSFLGCSSVAGKFRIESAGAESGRGEEGCGNNFLLPCVRWSRIDLLCRTPLEDVHWASDAVAGAALGYIVGCTVSRRTPVPGRIALAPLIDRREQAFGLNLYLTLR
jgi:hypothetical protein